MSSVAVKQAVVRARKIIRRKLRQLRAERTAADTTLTSTFKPITERIDHLTRTLSGKEEEEVDDIHRFINHHSVGELDKIYGVRKGDPNMLGTSPIHLTKQEIHVGGKIFPRTPGLLKLIFLKKLNSDEYTPKELALYAEIIQMTSAHLTPVGTIKSRNSIKYKTIILPALQTAGSGINNDVIKVLDQSHPVYIYWDDPNELVERLRLLRASAGAGNTAHTNEIVSIISELRERGIIE